MSKAETLAFLRKLATSPGVIQGIWDAHGLDTVREYFQFLSQLIGYVNAQPDSWTLNDRP